MPKAFADIVRRHYRHFEAIEHRYDDWNDVMQAPASDELMGAVLDHVPGALERFVSYCGTEAIMDSACPGWRSRGSEAP